jgi:two-component system NtrC family sensor kinase
VARILVVDDDRPIAALLADVIAGEGHTVDTAYDGLAALDRLAATSYDLVITDVRMPRLDGLGLYRALRERQPDLARRVVFITGDALDPATRDFVASTGALLLTKPFEIPRLLSSVHHLLAR